MRDGHDVQQGVRRPPDCQKNAHRILKGLLGNDLSSSKPLFEKLHDLLPGLSTHI